MNEGLLQSNVLDIEFDKNNFCWLSFASGIQKFDGKNFTNVPVQPGLPDDKRVNFFRCSNGDLLFSHSAGISKYEISNNRFIEIYRNPASAQSPAQFIGEHEKTISFYTSAGNITGLNSYTFEVVAEAKAVLPSSTSATAYIPKISDNIINSKVAFLVNHTLYLWDLEKQKIVYQSAAIQDIFYFFLKLKSETEVLYYDNKILLKKYNFKNKTTRTAPVKQKNTPKPFRSIIYSWQNKTLFSLYNKLYETDTSLNIKSELLNFQNQPIARTSSIARIKEDNFGNLYVVTISDGFRKIIRNNYPLKYYGTEKKENNYVISVFAHKTANRIFAGTSGSCLLIFDTLQRLLRHIKTLPGSNQPFSIPVITKAANGDYLLFTSGQSVWRLSSDLFRMTPFEFYTTLPRNKSGIGYFSNFLYQNDHETIIHSQGRLYKTDFNINTVNEYEVTGAAMSSIFYNNSIITHVNDQLVFFDAATFKELRKVPFKGTGEVRCFAKDAANNIYVGSNSGIFKIDSSGRLIKHLNKHTGLPDECIYAMSFDKAGFLWCSSNKGVFRIDKDNGILQLKKEDGLQENEFNTNAVARSEDGEIFFGGVNGISSFYPSAISDLNEKINLLVTGIKINNKEAFTDTAVWNIDKINLPYYQNSLSFDFIAMANNNPDQYIYQYRMKGMEEQWIQNNELQTVRYFLPPGHYAFQVAASRFFDKNAKPMKEISITIHQPFWKTGWFLTSVVAVCIAVMTYLINQYNRKRYRKRLMELESEHKIQQERERISRDLHDSIGAYANAVLYSTELLEKEKGLKQKDELMKDLKFASKDIITSLRATVWALKKDSYTAEDCLLRIRNFIQPFTRYYPHIHFSIEGEASAQNKLHYTKALNVLRTVQEAITNAIKHSSAANIRIISKGEAGKWELTVTDDGRGFNEQTIKETEQGNGLNNMKKRAIDSGVEFVVHSRPGAGTRIKILV